MGARGFVFSLDAFVAFVLIMITVSLLIFTIGTPKPYHAELEAAHILAHDTLRVLATSSDNPEKGTYLEQILENENNKQAINEIMKKVAGGDKNYRTIIPPGYGYMLQHLNVDGEASDLPEDEIAGANGWQTLYDAGTDGCPDGDRCGKSFTKLQASSTTFLSLYTIQPRSGESPYCYASCHGFEGIDSNGDSIYASTCNATPCERPLSNFGAGKSVVKILRLVVYT